MSQPGDQVMFEEYSRTREEIDQLNGQAFATLTGSLAVSLAILGAFFTSTRPREELVALPFLAFLALAVGSLVLAHKIRMAHRLALFLKYFVQPTIPQLKWPDTYFKFRELFKHKHPGLLASFPERFVEVQNSALVAAQFAAIGFTVYFGSRWLAGASGIILFVQLVLLRRINDYDAMEAVFKSMTQERPSAEQGAAPNRSPARPLGSPELTEGPPSVS
jgi:hypothetical protein